MTVASNYSKSNESAKEITNDAFYKVFMNLKDYDHGQSFKTWFRRVVVHTGIDHSRRHKMRLNNSDHIFKPEIQFNKSELELDSEYLFQLVRTLSPSYQMVFQQKNLRLSLIAQRKIFSVKRHKVMLNAGLHLANSSESEVTYTWQTVYGQQEIEQEILAESIYIDNVSIGSDATFPIMPFLKLVGTANYHRPIKNRLNNWNNEFNLSIGLRMNLN